MVAPLGWLDQGMEGERMASHNDPIRDSYTRDYHNDGYHFHNHDESETHFECPRCGKHCIIHIGDQTYACLSCGFRRDLSNQPTSGFSFLLLVLIALLLLLPV